MRLYTRPANAAAQQDLVKDDVEGNGGQIVNSLFNRPSAPANDGAVARPHSIANSAAMVRVETVRIKPEQGPGPAHMLRQRSGDIDWVLARQGMGNDKAACM